MNTLLFAYFSSFSRKKFLLVFLPILITVVACKSKNSNSIGNSDSLVTNTNMPSQSENKPKTHRATSGKVAIDTIVGDTIWVFPQGILNWSDTLVTKEFKTVFNVWVDTTDILIDTAETDKGGRITAGFNHYYRLDFTRKNKPWFSIAFNKEQNLESLIGGTDFWLESNLNVFHNLVYNKKYDKFVVEFDINSSYSYGSVYYFVFDSKGNIDYTGTVGTWGGGDPDGEPFLTIDKMAYVTCSEVYLFEKDTAISLADYASMSELKTYGATDGMYHWIHGLRNLNNNSFLTVFNRNDHLPEKNALIISTDTLILGSFKYYGLMEEMDAILLFSHDSLTHNYYLFDIDRETLILIDEKETWNVVELGIDKMIPVEGDTMLADKYAMIDFEVFGTYRFYKGLKDSIFYYDIDKLE